MKVAFVLISLIAYLSAESLFPLGANLDHVVDWTKNPVFVNQIKASRQFGQSTAPWVTTNMTYDANGWPTMDFGVILLGGSSILPEQAGVWYLSWNGNATVYPGATKATVLNQTYDAITNKGVAYINMPPTEYQLFLSFRNTKGGVTNLVAIRPGYNITNPPTFTNTFLNAVKGLNTFRFMDWAKTNDNPVTTWAERTAPQTAQSVNGIAWEYCIELANTVKSNIWVNVPHMADDDYVYQLAALLKDKLDPKLVVYVEYSNEVWNSGFSQFKWNYYKAVDMVNNGTFGPIFNYDSLNNTFYWGWRRVAWRAMTISNIFREVWGDCAINDRVRVVLAGQMVGPNTVETGLTMINVIYGPPSHYFYASSGAPYYGLGDANNNNNLTAEEVFQLLKNSSELMPTTYSYTENIGWATYYGIKYVAYEAGPDTFGPNSIQAKKAATLDARMTNVTINYLNTWYASGGDLLNWFIFVASSYDTQYGTWGVTDDITNLTTPKAIGIFTVASAPKPAITGGHLIPGVVRAGERINRPDTSGYWRYMGVGSKVLYLINDRHTFGAVYSVYMNYSSYYNTSVDMYLNTQKLYSIDLWKTNGAFSAPVNVTVYSGLSVLSLVYTTKFNYAYIVTNIMFDTVEELTSGPNIVSNCTKGTTTTTTTGGTTTATGTATTGTTTDGTTTTEGTTTGGATGESTTTTGTATTGTTSKPSDITKESLASKEYPIIAFVIASMIAIYL